ncbi:MAG: hypothetical protein JWL96_599 [Sphingomonas bacterium]|nr:hypothetical protein [Sphingomonas bacterium]
MGAAEALGGFRQNVLGGALRVRQHVRVPKPNNPPTLALQIFRPAQIGHHLLDMLATIELHPEPRLATSKIDNERRHHQLPRKGRPITRNQMPDRPFGRRRIVTQLARPSCQFRIDTPQHMANVARLATLANPPRTPPFQRGARIGAVSVKERLRR